MASMTGTRSQPTRPAPTRERLLDAAERLVGEHGFATTSLRAITEAAGANVAAVNYHFGSKDGLLRAVVARAMEAVNAERLRLLKDMDEPTAEDLVRAFVMTGVSVVERGGKRRAELARFLGRVMCEPDPAIRRLFADEVGPAERQYLDALVAALPDVPPQEVGFRYRAMVGLLGLYQSGVLSDLHPGRAEGARLTAEQETSYLVALLTMGLKGPVAT